MYDYGYSSEYDSQFTGVLAGIKTFDIILILVIGIFITVCMWKIFKKAGEKGWKTLIPIYNTIVLLDIVKLPRWYFILLLVPLVNIYIMIKIYIELSRKFNKPGVFAVGIMFLPLIFLAILAFSKDAVYIGNTTNQYSSQPMPSNQNMNYGQPAVNPVQQPIPNNQNMNYGQPAVNPVQQPTKTCSNCGRPLNPDDSFCIMCGKQV